MFVWQRNVASPHAQRMAAHGQLRARGLSYWQSAAAQWRLGTVKRMRRNNGAESAKLAGNS